MTNILASKGLTTRDEGMLEIEIFISCPREKVTCVFKIRIRNLDPNEGGLMREGTIQ